MPFDITSLCEPTSTALLVFECQQRLLEPGGPLPGLAAAVERGGIVEQIASLQSTARRRGVPVFFCTVHRRAGGGSAMSTPLEQRLRARSRDAAPPDLGDVVAALAPRQGEVVIDRRHGLTGFYESGLDPALRATGIRTIVLCGVSINLGILGTAIEAVNRGYAVVVPADCVAGDPPEYAEQALRYAVRNVAVVSDSAAVARAWGG